MSSSFAAIFAVALSEVSAGSLSDYQAVFQDATELRDRAVSLDNRWRDSTAFLNKSKQAAKNGDYARALSLAEKAKHQYKLAIEQVEINRNNLENTPFYDADALPADDIKAIQGFFRDKFPHLSDNDFANGFYAMAPVMRVNWEAIEEFPPYVPAIEEGEELWQTTFKDGKGYGYCFTGPDIMTDYPRWDAESGTVETLPMAINACRKDHGEQPLVYGKPPIIALQAYIAYKSRGNPTFVEIPVEDDHALKAYREGKKFYFSRRGQLNMACYHCHFFNAGMNIRANVLSPALGQTTHWPVYRSKWGEMGTLHRRYKGCNKQVRATPFDLQSQEYRNLEYFHTFISNGISVNGPGSRF
jgi:sulfur-oxidizing protein SoxA